MTTEMDGMMYPEGDGYAIRGYVLDRKRMENGRFLEISDSLSVSFARVPSENVVYIEDERNGLTHSGLWKIKRHPMRHPMRHLLRHLLCKEVKNEE